ncbi:Fe-S cluster assembly protein SufB [bacterium]|nr:Fe-S cluster assembly protein SufB [bacterium]
MSKANATSGPSIELVKEISKQKSEPSWMLAERLAGLLAFENLGMPKWGPDLSALNFDDLSYYVHSSDKAHRSWDDVPTKTRQTFEALGLPEAEQQHLAGLGAQYESDAVYHNLKKKWEAAGVIFSDFDTALREHPDIVKKYFGTVVPHNDNKFAGLNTAFWSGGSFVYVPKGVKIEEPLQAYYRINTKKMGQFERTLIIAAEGSHVHYVEGCTAPTYSEASLHAAVVEIIAEPGAHVRYTTIQNWSKNVYNLVTKRAHAHENSFIEWVDGNLGSRVTMKYPGVVLKGQGARTELLSIASASEVGQVQDSGCSIVHAAPNTTSKIISKSISSHGGTANFRGFIKAKDGATGCKSFTQCDSLILDGKSIANAYPMATVENPDIEMSHEARVSKVDDARLRYIMSRGISKKEAMALIVGGFIESFVKKLPMEYAVEMNRLIELEIGEDDE